MTFWQRLWRVELIGLASLCVFSIVLALVLVIEGLIMSPMETDSFDVAFLTFVLTFAYGFLPVTFDRGLDWPLPLILNVAIPATAVWLYFS